jgi:hypothetical protein
MYYNKFTYILNVIATQPVCLVTRGDAGASEERSNAGALERGAGFHSSFEGGGSSTRGRNDGGCFGVACG